MEWIALYLLLINVFAYAQMGWDKHLSKCPGARRIPEKRLFLAALLGGSLGAAAGMYGFRHKTRHWYFRLGLPLILAVQVIAAVLVRYKLA